MSYHNTDNAAMRYTLGPIGVIGALVLLGVSCTMNYRFGHSLGKTPFDGYVYGLASVAADVFKAIAPFFFFAAWRSKAWAVVIAAFVVWLVTTVYALTGALGHSLLNRTETAGQRSLAAETHKDLRSDLKRNQDQLSWLPPHRAAAAVKSELESLKAQRLWLTTAECQEATGKTAREFCSGYHKIDAELGNALQADKLNTKIDEINAKLSGTKSDAMSDADPQANTISKALDVGLSKVQLGLALLVVALIEFGSGFGPYVSLAYMFAFGQSRSNIINANHRELPKEPAEQPRGQGQTDQISAVPLITHSSASARAPEEPPDPEPATVLRARLPGADGALKAIGIPFTGDRKGPPLDPLPGREAAEALVSWIRAHDLARDDLSSEQISAYDAECCQMRHRRQTLDSDVKEALPRLRGVEKGRPKQPDGSRPVRYGIKPGKYPKPEPQATPEPAEAKQEGGKVFAFGRRPLAVAPHEVARHDVGSGGAHPANVHQNPENLLMRRAA